MAGRTRKVSAKGQRFDARLTDDQKRLFQRAAALRGSTVTRFVIDSAQDVAEQIIQAQEVTRLTASETAAFVQAILDPPPPNEALRAAAERYKSFTTS